ncbi:MAG: MBL fold metallo-hydrolase [Myxococcota bacterium]
MTIEIQTLGVGDAFSELYCSTAFILQCEGFRLAIDCPDRYRAVLKRLRDTSGSDHDLNDIDDFLITHVHGDHMNGLEAVAFYKRFVQGRRLRLYSAPEVRASMWDERLKGSMATLWDGERLNTMSFDDYFDFEPLAWESSTMIGPFSIRTRRTKHHVPTSALLIEAGGVALGYSSDTAFDSTLIDFLSQADLIIHETNLGPSHTSLAQLLELPDTIRHKLRLVHYPDVFDPNTSPIPALREGQRICLNPGERVS